MEDDNQFSQSVAGRLKRTFKRKRNIVIIVIIIAIIAFFSLRGGGEPEYERVSVIRSTLVQEVDVTGKVKPVQSVDLSFEKSGKVKEILVSAGDQVYRGQPLVRLDATSDQLSLREYEATLAQNEATLLELKNGTRPEDLAILQSKVDSAAVALVEARKGLLDKLRDSYTKTDDAIRNYGDQFFDNPRTNPSINITINDTQLKIDLNEGRADMESTLGEWKNLVDSLSLDSDFSSVVDVSRSNLSQAKLFLDKLAAAVNFLTSDQSLSQTTISTYKANVSTARGLINTALSNLSTEIDALNSAISSLDLAQKNLELAEAGTVAEKITAQESKILADKARIESIKYSISISTLRAPFAGTVSRQEADLGEVVSTNDTIVSIISSGALEIEAFVPEVDVGILMVGNKADVTFDAFSSSPIVAVVRSIDPAATVIDGIPTYKVKFDLEEEDMRVRPGMTANITINALEKPDTLLIPQRAIEGRGNNRTVSVMSPSGEIVEKSVVLGLRSSSGEYEILSGLEEGDTVIIRRP